MQGEEKDGKEKYRKTCLHGRIQSRSSSIGREKGKTDQPDCQGSGDQRERTVPLGAGVP